MAASGVSRSGSIARISNLETPLNDSGLGQYQPGLMRLIPDDPEQAAVFGLP
jgi:hypothetical protein